MDTSLNPKPLSFHRGIRVGFNVFSEHNINPEPVMAPWLHRSSQGSGFRDPRDLTAYGLGCRV